jgi:hypothetical protein
MFVSFLTIYPYRRSNGLHRSTRFRARVRAYLFNTQRFCARNLLRTASANRRLVLKTFGAHLAAMHHSSAQARLARIIVLVLRFRGGAFGIAARQAQNLAPPMTQAKSGKSWIAAMLRDSARSLSIDPPTGLGPERHNAYIRYSRGESKL